MNENRHNPTEDRSNDAKAHLEKAKALAKEAAVMAEEAAEMARAAKEGKMIIPKRRSAPSASSATPSASVAAAPNPTQQVSASEPCRQSLPEQEAQHYKQLYETEKAQRKSMAALTAAVVLSLCSILLLTAVLFCAAAGVFTPTDNKTVQLQVSGDNSSSGTPTLANPEAITDFMDSVVIVNSSSATGDGTGSGIVLTADGYIVTNYHVVEGANRITVGLYSGETFNATVVGHTELDDIAVLKIEAAGLRPATFAKLENCHVGEDVYAIGCPEGEEFAFSVTKGIISALDREIKIYDNEGILEKKMYVVQTDASVNPGNSGGPLINSRGEVVGIITLKLSYSAGMGFALPSDGAVEIITAIIETGSADNVNSSVSRGRPLIGITGVGVEGNTWYENIQQNGQGAIQPVTEAYATAHPDTTFYAPVTGVHVSATSPTLDAATKLKVNDIITKVEGYTVRSIYEVMDIINTFDGGDTVELEYYRDGQYYTVTVTLGTAAE